MSRTGVYAYSKLDLFSGTLSLLSSTLKAVAVTGLYTQDFANDRYLTAIPSLARATAGVLMTSKTLTRAADTVVFRADNVSFPAPTAGQVITGLVLYEDTGTEGTSRLVAYIDYFSNLPLITSGGNVTFTWPAYAILIMQEGVLAGPQGIPGPAGPALTNALRYDVTTTSDTANQVLATLTTGVDTPAVASGKFSILELDVAIVGGSSAHPLSCKLMGSFIVNDAGGVSHFGTDLQTVNEGTASPATTVDFHIVGSTIQIRMSPSATYTGLDLDFAVMVQVMPKQVNA